MASTRSESAFYLIGTPDPDIRGSKLPSKKQVLSVFLYHHIVEKKTIRESATLAFNDLKAFWSKAGIPTRAAHKCIAKIENLHSTWLSIKKNKNRETNNKKQKEQRFTNELNDLFDVAHANAMFSICKEDQNFLQAQREPGRRGCIGSEDRIEAALQQRRLARQESESKRRRTAQENKELNLKVELTSSTESSSEEDSDDEPEQYFRASSASIHSPLSKVKNIVTPALAAALDRTNITSRSATFVIAETVRSLGGDVGEYNVNPTSIHRLRAQHRSDAHEKLKASFESESILTVHWDGKLISDLEGHGQVDRLPVLITSGDVSQLLGVPKKHHGTGFEQADAVETCLKDWNVEAQVQAMCFDTTAANTGVRGGTCRLLEERFNRQLLHLACRHHIHEVVLGGVLKPILEPTSAPDNPLFKRFRDAWPTIEQDSYEAAATDPAVEALVAPKRRDLIVLYHQQLSTVHPRDDHREIIEIALVFLGASSDEVRFRRPGAVHHARWISKALYVIKMWLFRRQFLLRARDLKAVRDAAVFSVLLYTKHWMTASQAAAAPRCDFEFMRELLHYPDKEVAGLALHKLRNHLWYLSDELVALAFFDQNVPSETKRQMVHSLTQQAGPRQQRPQLPAEVFTSGKGLEQFVTERTLQFFRRLRLPEEFLDVDPSQWDSRVDFEKARHLVESLNVVNDFAERAVALVETYNKKLTVKEDQFQFLLSIVQEHRKRYPDTQKKNFV